MSVRRSSHRSVIPLNSMVPLNTNVPTTRLYIARIHTFTKKSKDFMHKSEQYAEKGRALMGKVAELVEKVHKSRARVTKRAAKKNTVPVATRKRKTNEEKKAEKNKANADRAAARATRNAAKRAREVKALEDAKGVLERAEEARDKLMKKEMTANNQRKLETIEARIRSNLAKIQELQRKVNGAVNRKNARSPNAMFNAPNLL
jgi:predicted ribosome quality control (RQC) complex YloA/Tae2 family protein